MELLEENSFEKARGAIVCIGWTVMWIWVLYGVIDTEIEVGSQRSEVAEVYPQMVRCCVEAGAGYVALSLDSDGSGVGKTENWVKVASESMTRSPHFIELYSDHSVARRWMPDGEPLNAQQITIQTTGIGDGETGRERLTDPSA